MHLHSIAAPFSAAATHCASGPLPIRQEGLRGDGLRCSKEVALAVQASRPDQRLPQFGGLDPLSHQGKTKRGAELDEHPHDRPAAGLPHETANERRIELYPGDGQVAQVASVTNNRCRRSSTNKSMPKRLRRSSIRWDADADSTIDASRISSTSARGEILPARRTAPSIERVEIRLELVGGKVDVHAEVGAAFAQFDRPAGQRR